jgi:hypothetical protein
MVHRLGDSAIPRPPLKYSGRASKAIALLPCEGSRLQFAGRRTARPADEVRERNSSGLTERVLCAAERSRP